MLMGKKRRGCDVTMKKEKKLAENEQDFLVNVAVDLEKDDSFVKKMMDEVEEDALFMRVYTRILSKR